MLYHLVSQLFISGIAATHAKQDELYTLDGEYDDTPLSKLVCIHDIDAHMLSKTRIKKYKVDYDAAPPCKSALKQLLHMLSKMGFILLKEDSQTA